MESHTRTLENMAEKRKRKNGAENQERGCKINKLYMFQICVTVDCIHVKKKECFEKQKY